MDHRRTVFAVIAALLASMAIAATQGPPAYVYTGTAPSGACLEPRVWIDALGTGTWYCNAGTWTKAAGGTPGGSDSQIQYNNGGAFGGAATLKWDSANGALLLGSGATGISTAGGAELVLESANTTPWQWNGRAVVGGSGASGVVFLLGQAMWPTAKAWIGAHNGDLNAWADIYMNPDGPQTIWLGAKNSVSNTDPLLKLDNAANLISAYVPIAAYQGVTLPQDTYLTLGAGTYQQIYGDSGGSVVMGVGGGANVRATSYVASNSLTLNVAGLTKALGDIDIAAGGNLSYLRVGAGNTLTYQHNGLSKTYDLLAPMLSDLSNPAGDTAWTFPSGKKLLWTFTGNTDEAFTIHGDGAFTGTGDLVHIHKSGTGAAVGADALHVEVDADTNMTGVRVTMANATRDAISTNAKITALGGFVGALSGNASTATALSTSSTTDKFWRADNTWAVPPTGAAGAGNFVRALVDFGSGNTTASLTITGQTWVATNSMIVCSPSMVATTSRGEGAEDVLLESIVVAAHTKVVGVGFSVTAHAPFGTSGVHAFDCTGGAGTIATSMTASVTNPNPIGSCAGTTCTATTGNTTCSGVGGSGSYTYAWTYISGLGLGQSAITSPSTATTAFSSSVTGTETGTFRCTVTDTVGGATAVVDVNIELTSGA